MICLTLLSVVNIKQRRMLGWLMNWKWRGKNRSWPIRSTVPVSASHRATNSLLWVWGKFLTPVFNHRTLTLILLTWRIWWAPNNASRCQVGYNSAFKELNWVGWVERFWQNRILLSTSCQVIHGVKAVIFKYVYYIVCYPANLKVVVILYFAFMIKSGPVCWRNSLSCDFDIYMSNGWGINKIWRVRSSSQMTSRGRCYARQ
jgi:hypothetical protein